MPSKRTGKNWPLWCIVVEIKLLLETEEEKLALERSFQNKTRRGSPVGNRPSTNLLQQFDQRKEHFEN